MSRSRIRFHHEHYTYSLRFNCIRMSLDANALCSIEEQRTKKNLQNETSYWKQPEHRDEPYIAFCGSSHCCLIETTRETSAASSATASRSYSLINVPAAEWLELSSCSSTSYISPNTLLFNSGLIPAEACKSYMNITRTALLEMWASGETSVPKIVSLFDDNAIAMDIVKVDKEVQFNSWVFKQMEMQLRRYGFIVEEDKINKQIIPSVCEFSTSKPDCIIYHPNTVFVNNTLVGFSVTVYEQAEQSEDELTDIKRIITTGCLIEVKSESPDNAAINECVYDMFGGATKFITMGLQLGKLVDKAHMYGLLVGMNDTNDAQLLKLEMDFLHNNCEFKTACTKYDFVSGINIILHKLYSK